MNDFKYLQYVKNTNGGATRAHFLEDWEPIGEMVWNELKNNDLVREDQNGRIHLTPNGEGQLRNATHEHQ